MPTVRYPFAMFTPGTPVSQGSKIPRPVYTGRGAERTFTGRVALEEAHSQELDDWRDKVLAAASLHMLDFPRGTFPLRGAVVARMVFVVPRPKTVRRAHPEVKPDLDKYVRAVGDALTDAQVWADDGQLVGFDRLWKAYPGGDPEAPPQPGVVVKLRLA